MATIKKGDKIITFPAGSGVECKGGDPIINLWRKLLEIWKERDREKHRARSR